MTEQATLKNKMLLKMILSCEMLLKVGKITIDDHGLKRVFL